MKYLNFPHDFLADFLEHRVGEIKTFGGLGRLLPMAVMVRRLMGGLASREIHRPLLIQQHAKGDQN